MQTKPNLSTLSGRQFKSAIPYILTLYWLLMALYAWGYQKAARFM